MSLLSPDEFHVVLYPDRLALSHTRLKMGLRGAGRRVLETRVVAAREGGETAWSGAVAALEEALKGKAGKRARATVFLSNHLVRYALVPWSDALSGEDEELMAARHCFRNVYGDAADAWDLRLSPGRAGEAQLASALDARLPEGLRGAFERQGIEMVSLQPQLMAAYNANVNSLRDRDTWFLVQEPGSLCLTRLERGGWASVRTVRIGGGWLDELPLLLEREAYLTDAGAVSGEVLLCATSYGEAVWPARRRWKLERALLPAPSCQIPQPGECVAEMAGA